MADVKLALCGLGRAGKIHFRGVRDNPRCQLKYIVDCVDVPAVAERIRSFLEQYRMQDSVTLVKTDDYESVVLADPDIHGVIITTPTPHHESYVKRALNSKKAVFCEKPLAHDLVEVLKCYDIAEKNKIPLYCAFQRRFDPGMSKLRRKIEEGKIGKVFQVKSTSRDSPCPSIEYIKTAGGMFHDTAVHDIDIICWTIGEAPVGVFAQGSAFDPKIAAIGDLDTITLTLKFPSGALAVCDLSRHSNYGYDMRLEVFGEKGAAMCENVYHDPSLYYSEDGCSTSAIQYSFPERFKVAYKRELDHFVDMVLDPSVKCLVTRDEVVLVTRVADACNRSIKEGGRMVELEPVPQI